MKQFAEDQEKRETQINSQLEENATLLEQLSREQHERLSRPLPASLNNLAVPSQQELQLVLHIAPEVGPLHEMLIF
ncbi:hypothetical protein E2C01_026071 [Portunus trituberculatus]|uniref:Uncharacterized protein n=1 Tax=Portunus trituberculatus TaxID=210409 RepID=A0A5B7EJP6_PORTR|nr:hypothetical protein [Portunus trituberculatus]